jgi:hypothetical protein
MFRNHILRLSVVAAVTAVPVLAGAVPAQADPPELAMVLPGVTIPVGETGTRVTPRVTTTAKHVLARNTTTYDLNGPGELSLPAGTDCERPGPKKIICTTAGRTLHVDYINQLPTVIVKAAEPSADTGELTVTLTADGIPAVTATSRVRTAEIVDLAAGDSGYGSVPFGGLVDVPVEVRNEGDRVAHGAAVLFAYDSLYQFKSGTTFSNCSYKGDLPVSCVFDQELAVGRSYRAKLPYRVRPDAYSPSEGYQFFQHLWLTPAELEDMGTLGTPGTGGKLTLGELAKTLADPQADPDKTNNTAYVTMAITGPKRWIDLQGVGDRVGGRKGDVVTVKVGFRNLGPAVYDAYDPVHSTFNVPPGTTVVGDIPWLCASPDEDGGVDTGTLGQPGAPFYRCSADPVLLVGESHTFEFHLRIDKVIPNAKGTFIAGGAPCQRECPIFQSDTNLRNNEVPVIVNPRAHPPAGGDTGGGGGGGLPVTGPGGAPVAATGLALTAAGVLLLLAGRRRRVGTAPRRR